ncbi:putative metallophosphoesterase YhaO [Rubripirellula obstinata]|uniref:Putative metallophosphoesterase YhaO n=1 Tax=Rubripirellula obstinata TaxID=406547 RepID=A0A5B1CK97_9BACT|nr:DNA repair exonuclease [Rubripirellula obstinata]KAA1259754.1 putative metallophosphoesterase YhaO [Rubripirellula obstinata]
MASHKILHAADIHLDSPLRNLTKYEDAPADQIRGASRRALENMVQLAMDQQVDLVVIAGDLYDGDWPDQNTGLFFVAQARRLIDAGIPIAVIRGNHDAFNKMTLNLRLPKNPDGSEVMLSEKTVDTREFDFDGLAVAVHGRSYRKQHERGDLVKDYPQPISGQFNLGLLHTSLTGFEGHTAYAPCSPQQLADFGYDYWALGHIHQRGEHQIEGSAPVVFSGNVQGRKINEPGAKGCVIVDIDSRGETTRTFHPLDVVRFEWCRIDASEAKRIDDIADQYEQWLETKLEEVDDRLLVPRVEITGTTQLHRKLGRQYESIEASLRSVSINTGGGQVWLEKFKLRTNQPQQSAATDSTGQVDQGAIASVTAVVNELKNGSKSSGVSAGELFPEDDQSVASDWVKEELSLLMTKMPKELSGENAVVNLDNEVELQEWIEQATGELMGRLQPGE